MKNIIYNISGRSFHCSSLGRKISEVIHSWQINKYDLNIVCGGDINGMENKAQNNNNYGAAEFHKQSFRKKKFLIPLIHSFSELKDIIHDRKLYTYLSEKFNNKQIDLIWERSSRLHFAGYRYAKKRGLPFVLEWKDHLIDYRFSLFKPLALWVENIKEKNADFIVVESEVLKKDLMKKGIQKEKIFVAYNAVNPEEFKTTIKYREDYRNSLGVNDQDLIVGYLGSYAFYHDTERLIYAAKIIKDKGVENIKFLLVGNGKDYQKCYDLAETLEVLGHNIIFKEGVPKEEVPAILSAIDISVLPGSTDIICPIKVFEYMAAETAVLLPDYACNKEVINDCENGMLFKPHDEDNLAEKILYVSRNHALAKQMGVRARETVIEKFTWEKTWGMVMDNIMEKIGEK